MKKNKGIIYVLSILLNYLAEVVVVGIYNGLVSEQTMQNKPAKCGRQPSTSFRLWLETW